MFVTMSNGGTMMFFAFVTLSGLGWALGWNSIQYLLNSEIYPLRLRALGGSIAMTFHFVNRKSTTHLSGSIELLLTLLAEYGNSKAVPSMFVTMSNGGTMMFFAFVTLSGLGWAYFFLPELANKSLEAVDAVFALPWYQIGRKGKQLTQGMGSVLETDAVHGKGEEKMDYVEDVREVSAERKA